MKRYAELYGNMQRYRIKSLYGNKLNLALMPNYMDKLTEIANASATKMREAVEGPAMQNLVRMNERTKELIDATIKPNSTFGKRLPRREVIHGCEPG